MNEILEPILSRTSIRKYKNQNVTDDQVKILLESARFAPSGNNTQPWNFIIVRSEEMRQKLTVASKNQTWMKQAPVFIACVADICARFKDNVPRFINEESPELEVKQIIRDTAIAVEHLVLQAQAMGLSTCWIAEFTQEEIRPVLDIPEDKYLVAIVTVGYADKKSVRVSRRRLEDMIYHEKWGKK
jgi:nitroreductase